VPSDPSRIAILAIFLVLSLVVLIPKIARRRFRAASYLKYLWALFLFLSVAEFFSFRIAIWILGVMCYLALREYFTLVDLRLQDRWALLGSYLAIPFMIYFIQIDWYGMFIISIPVYAFLVIPFLVALGGGETQGTVFSIGAINFGLFLLVFCIGHIGYLASYGSWGAIGLILAVAACDGVAALLKTRGRPAWLGALLLYVVSAPITVALAWGLSGWAATPWGHAVALGLLTPLLVAIGRYTIPFIEADLGMREGSLRPGRGQILDNLQSYVYAAPIVFHYIRYFFR
jgi:phosphatidate cytidylyltransferase